MIIQHNILALNTSRQNNLVVKSKQKQMKQLSSGYKINCAADNAAGLSISEKMRKQVRGLTRAVENIEDGVSLCQVADGALTEVQEILQRMNELSVQSANGINSQSDRSYIQDEIDALTNEIDRIAFTATFNEHIYPLKGSKVENGTIEVLDNAVIGDTTTAKFSVNIYEITKTYNCPSGKKTVTGLALDGSTMMRLRNAASISITTPSLGSDDMLSLTLKDLNVDDDNRVWINEVVLPAGIVRKNYLCTNPYNSNIHTWLPTSGALPTGYNYIYAISDKNKSDLEQKKEKNITLKEQGKVWIQMGAEAREGMFINLVDATVKGIGLEGINMLTEENAGKTIDTISSALRKVSKYRSDFGAQQNRLEHGLLINENVIENTTAAESRIRDTVMAKEMVKFSIQNILGQFGQSMLSQANQSNQGILNLLT